MPKPKKTPSGAQSLRDRGLVGVLVPVTREEKHLLRQAAARADRPVTQFARAALVDAARKLIPEKD